MKPQCSVTLSAKLKPRRQGSIVIIVASSMAFILGCAALSVDYGFLINDANNTQRAVDSAALAAASELRTTVNPETNKEKARDIAVVVAAQNGVALDRNKVTFPRYDAQTNAVGALTSSNVNSNAVRVEHVTGRSFLFGPAIGVKKGQVSRAATAVLKVTDSTSNGAPMGITEETANYYKEPQRLTLANNVAVPLTLVRTNKSPLAQISRSVNGAQIPRLDPFALFDLRGTSINVAGDSGENDPNGKSPAQMLQQFLGESDAVATKGGYETALNAEYKTAQLNKLEEAVTTIFARSAQPPWNDSPAGWDDGTTGGTKFADIAASSTLRSNPRVVNVIVTPKRTTPEGGNFNALVKDITPIYLQYATITEEQVLDSDGDPVFDNKGQPITEPTIKLWVRFLTPTTGGGGGSPVNETSVGESSGNYSISLVQ